jgi:hypothetical protein
VFLVDPINVLQKLEKLCEEPSGEITFFKIRRTKEGGESSVYKVEP